ncbi:hypothetical protein [Mycobacteroides salmoniphilum]|uniref:SnoaL-like domain protein n=1 Tax=Mycobacteroides salmoniphilum TaxID=404941 RepID=A0A4R8SBK5_9MYCO|nr:hypothetical protein [Mycobacteroides salmoniphilum]TDZ91963.1 hypothetical protein CCUG60885_04076 [Mycobacteroides salmoniphilum]TEA07194.1 hypothetical protein CCUG60883_01226 [Mycobacteroides salmoniphilum]
MSKNVFAWVAALFVAIGLVTQTAVASATGADEAEIRDVTAGRLSALQAVDALQYASFFCGDVRDKIESDWGQSFSPPEVSRLEGANLKKLRAKVRQVFPLASNAAVEDFVTAVDNQEQQALSSAWHRFWVETFAHLTFTVTKVTVNGDAANATIAFRNTGGRGNEPRKFVREDGAWKDCTPEATQTETAIGNDAPLLEALTGAEG